MSATGKPLFGNPTWFKLVQGGLGIIPATRPGWIFAAGWLAAILVPAALLSVCGKGLEGLLWVAFSLLLLVRETRQIVHSKRREEVFVIDENTDVTKVTTKNYDLELKN
ncbi:MAG: hypothetical protein KDB14_05490 [Planctomycetales bacterium]|nr:hypothetical protein [Planctomycetales bacterium]